MSKVHIFSLSFCVLCTALAVGMFGHYMEPLPPLLTAPEHIYVPPVYAPAHQAIPVFSKAIDLPVRHGKTILPPHARRTGLAAAPNGEMMDVYSCPHGRVVVEMMLDILKKNEPMRAYRPDDPANFYCVRP